MKTILIVDDDVYIGNMLEETLIKERYHVLRAYSGTEALLVLHSNTPDLILLDLMLPGLSGEELLPRIQGIPVIVLSAKVDVEGKAALLLAGAADYITKPFASKELLARIAVQLRGAPSAGKAQELLFGKLAMDLNTHTVRLDRAPLRLTKTEYAILKALLRHPSQVLTKSQILDLISMDTPDCMESSLKVHISNLRKKLRAAGDGELIESVWGIGFRLREGEPFTQS